ncbi:MAG: hypothetical protein ABJA87_14020 [bacterium]
MSRIHVRTRRLLGAALAGALATALVATADSTVLTTSSAVSSHVVVADNVWGD